MPNPEYLRDTLQDVSDLVNAAVAEHGFPSHEQLRRSGVSAGTVRGVMSGPLNMSLGTLARALDACGLRLVVYSTPAVPPPHPRPEMLGLLDDRTTDVVHITGHRQGTLTFRHSRRTYRATLLNWIPNDRTGHKATIISAGLRSFAADVLHVNLTLGDQAGWEVYLSDVQRIPRPRHNSPA